jgi:hypothetical protein
MPTPSFVHPAFKSRAGPEGHHPFWRKLHFLFVAGTVGNPGFTVADPKSPQAGDGKSLSFVQYLLQHTGARGQQLPGFNLGFADFKGQVSDYVYGIHDMFRWRYASGSGKTAPGIWLDWPDDMMRQESQV